MPQINFNMLWVIAIAGIAVSVAIIAFAFIKMIIAVKKLNAVQQNEEKNKTPTKFQK